MKLVTKAALLMSLVSSVTVTTAIIVSKSNVATIYASECEHEGNHYTTKNATRNASGIKEYWVCCKCHEHFLYKPNGSWADAGVASVIIDSSDNRYIPSTNAYDDQGFRYSADGKTIVGYTPVPGVTDIVIPDGVTDVGTVFAGTSITSISIPSSMETIDGGAFRNCSDLKNVTISEGVKSIESSNYGLAIYGAFQNCESLEYIVIPSTVTTLEELAFGTANRNLKIYCCVQSRPSGWDSSWNYRTVFGNPYTTYWEGQWHYDSNGVPVKN